MKISIMFLLLALLPSCSSKLDICGNTIYYNKKGYHYYTFERQVNASDKIAFEKAVGVSLVPVGDAYSVAFDISEGFPKRLALCNLNTELERSMCP